MTQLKTLERLITRKTGATSVDICRTLPSVCPHKRLSELKQRGWTITSKQGNQGLLRYFGKPPKGC